MSLMSSEPVYVEIDNNNYDMIHQLLFYLDENNYLKQDKGFILDSYRAVEMDNCKKNYLLMIPKNGIQFSYNDPTYGPGDIHIEYFKARDSRNCNMTEIRFDKLQVASYHPEHAYEHVQEFLQMLLTIVLPDSGENKVCKYIWDEDASYWIYNKNVKSRNLETIYFPQKKKIVDSLERFLNDAEQEKLYHKLGIPYKYVVLFHGLPGTGKTSLIRALATQFGYNLSIVKGLSKMDDQSLEQMISKLRKRTFLVFEDIDHLFDSSKLRISYSGILNMLDGASYYDKLVVFITTNRIQYLDHILKRRVDLFVEFTYIHKKEILTMYHSFFPNLEDTDAEAFCARVQNKKLTVNMLEKYFMYCLQNKITPLEDLSYLNEYHQMTSEQSISQLYQ